MLRIRLFEGTLADLIDAGEVKTPCHLYIGQEAIASGVCAALRPQDTIWGGHRSHGHYLAKGGDLTAMMTEIFGKVTGCSRGRGGSMHIVAPKVGLLGTVPLVAATIPLSVGAGFSCKLRKDGGVAVAFFGDGATEEGHFHESMALASKYGLPVIFVCENNYYASHLSLLERRTKDNISESAGAHGMAGSLIDGNDVLGVYSTAADAVLRARENRGPTLIECRTYRWRGHVGSSWDMDVGVKRRDELKEWLDRDPIPRLRKQMLVEGVPNEWFEGEESAIREEINIALKAAREDPYPSTEEVGAHVFVKGIEG